MMRLFFGRKSVRAPVQTGVRCWVCWAHSSCMPFRRVAERAGWFNEQRAESARGRDIPHFQGLLEKVRLRPGSKLSGSASRTTLMSQCCGAEWAPTEILELRHSFVQLNPKRSLLPSLLPKPRNKPKGKPVWWCHLPYLICILLNKIKLDFQLKDWSGAWRSIATTGRDTWTFRNFPVLFQNSHFLMMQQPVHWG